MSRYNDIPVFIINMANRPDRKEHMKLLMNQLGFTNYTFVVPFAANENTKQLFEQETGKPFGLSLTKVSHNMTYLSLLKLQNVDNMIILEDDIAMTKDLENMKKELNIIVNNHPKDTDMVYMEMCMESCSMEKVDGFVKLVNPYCAAAIYYPSKESRNHIVNMLINESGFSNEAIDTSFIYLISSGFINAYMHNLLFIQDNNFGSDLEGSIGYGSDYKPLSPACPTLEQTIEYFNKEEFNNKVKELYQQELSYQIEKLKCEFEEEKDEDDFNFILIDNNKKDSRHLIVIIILLIFIIIILSSFLVNRNNSYNSQYSYNYSS